MKHKTYEAVAIGRLERFVGDNARPPKAKPPVIEHKLGKVAIAGSGPAGLAAAADLVRYGADVTVYEALHVLGGVLQYGIPAFRLPRDIIAREIQRLKDYGVKFETNKVVGKTFTIDQLMNGRGFDAVFVAAGAGAPAFLGIPGEFAGRVYSANEFLTRINLMGGDRFPYQDTPVSFGESVVVIGAGNTAMDCLRVAKRVGARSVRCVYRRSEAEAPARIEEIRHAKEEGIDFFFLHGPVEILINDDRRRARHQGAENGAGRARRARTPPAGAPRRVRRAGLRHRDLRARHQGEPDHRPVGAGPSALTAGATSSRTTRRWQPICRASSPAAISFPAARPSFSP